MTNVVRKMTIYYDSLNEYFGLLHSEQTRTEQRVQQFINTKNLPNDFRQFFYGPYTLLHCFVCQTSVASAYIPPAPWMNKTPQLLTPVDMTAQWTDEWLMTSVINGIIHIISTPCKLRPPASYMNGAR